MTSNCVALFCKLATFMFSSYLSSSTFVLFEEDTRWQFTVSDICVAKNDSP